MGGAISPQDISAHKAKTFPEFVFDAFNDLIAQNFSNGSPTVLQKDVVALMLAKANKDISAEELDEEFGGYGRSLSRDQIFALGYLNVEDVYREKGWKVTYDKPAYNETYDASFTFRSR